ncbi:hypothetical protein [Sphingomonas sp. R86520]|uniref:hypothetical protein n=1 Tax=Sphingomonas sp. R86520 TaxID=3093859 RepID=UPI0036D25ECF
MNLKAFTGGALAIAMLSTSVAATAAPVANSASALRVGSVTKGKSEVAGGGVIAALLLAGVAAIGVVAIVKDSDDNSDSN